MKLKYNHMKKSGKIKTFLMISLEDISCLNKNGTRQLVERITNLGSVQTKVQQNVLCK